MKYNLINIHTSKKIVFNAIFQKKDFLKNYDVKLKYFEICKNIDINNKYINIIFIPHNINKSDITQLKSILKKSDSKKNILCIEKNIRSFFLKLNDNIMFLPISFADLEKKINLINISTKIKYKNIELNNQSNVLFNITTKKSIKLTGIELNILNLLMSERKPTSRSEINQKALGYSNIIDSHSIDSHIYRLRKKLKEISKEIKIITKPPGWYQIS